MACTHPRRSSGSPARAAPAAAAPGAAPPAVARRRGCGGRRRSGCRRPRLGSAGHGGDPGRSAPAPEGETSSAGRTRGRTPSFTFDRSRLTCQMKSEAKKGESKRGLGGVGGQFSNCAHAESLKRAGDSQKPYVRWLNIVEAGTRLQ